MSADYTSPQANPSQLVTIGTVAAQNIAKALELPETSVKTIERAIADEIQAMSSHFTLAIADVQTQYEIAVSTIKSEFSFVKANPVKIGGVALVVAIVFGVLGHVL